jgi:hypothetical protein
MHRHLCSKLLWRETKILLCKTRMFHCETWTM